MSARTEVVPYVWNTLDGLAAQVGVGCTPYKIPAAMLNDAAAWRTGNTVLLPLSLSAEPATLGRFFREGYEWVDVPEGIHASTLIELFGQLFQHDNKRFAHMDPLLVIASATANDVARVQAMRGATMATSSASCARMQADPGLMAAHALLSIPQYVDPGMIPFADLAFLHFEYWGNSELRFAVLDEMFKRVTPPSSTGWDFTLGGLISPRFPLAIPWSGFFGGLLSMILPQALPFEKNGKKVQKVLARSARKGVPIRALATHVGEAVQKIKVTSLEAPIIELDGFATQTLAPIYLNEWQTGSSKLRFRITIPVSAQKTILEIVRGETVIYRKTHDFGEFVVPGVHLWNWDGYDDNGVFDTMVLKSDDLEARVTVTDMHGRVAVARTELAAGPGTIRWVDARIDKKAKQVDVTVHARFSNPSDVEIASVKIPLPQGMGQAIGSMLDPVGGAQGFSLIPMAASIPGVSEAMPEASNLPVGDLVNNNQLALSLNIPKSFDLPESQFEQFKADILFGIGFHWSRQVTLDGATFQLSVGCRERATDAVRTFLARPAAKAFQELGIGDGSPFGGPQVDTGGRSFNLAAIMEGLPIVDIWNTSEADQYMRRYVGAHELGHSVLREAYDPVYSICHKGTSSVGQASFPTGPVPGATGELDVMLYWMTGVGLSEADYARVRATEDDARALIWMAKVVFG